MMRTQAPDLPEDPSALHRALEAASDVCFLLESAEGPRQLARYSFLGWDPAGVVRARGGDLDVTGDLPEPRDDEAPLDYLRRARDAHAVEGVPDRYAGGLVGVIGYETVETLEPVPPREDRGPYPDLELGLFLDGVVYDHADGEATYFAHGEDRSDELEAVAADPPDPDPPTFGAPSENMSRKAYEEAVATAKDRIRQGEIFQAVLSRRTALPVEGSLAPFYEALKGVNPSPYMYHLRFGEREVVGASPEMLVRVEDGQVETFPIAGTRPLGATPEETEALAQDMLEDEKERAEHAMLVDLARNDVGRVAAHGTVEVPRRADVERYSHVQHLVSQVEGTLRDDADAVDALAAVFPAGTVSGAPKVRAMEIIRELEPTARGPYAGAVGYLSLNGNLDTAITIRTLTRTGDTAHVQAGAGIVDDSVPAREYEETGQKQQVLLDLAERFREGSP
jgi:anthranilate synthase component 1